MFELIPLPEICQSLACNNRPGEGTFYLRTSYTDKNIATLLLLCAPCAKLLGE